MNGNWSVTPAFSRIYSRYVWKVAADFELTPGEFRAPIEYLQLEIRCSNRNYPTVIHVPIQDAAAITYQHEQEMLKYPGFFRIYERNLAARNG